MICISDILCSNRQSTNTETATGGLDTHAKRHLWTQSQHLNLASCELWLTQDRYVDRPGRSDCMFGQYRHHWLKRCIGLHIGVWTQSISLMHDAVQPAIGIKFVCVFPPVRFKSVNILVNRGMPGKVHNLWYDEMATETSCPLATGI
jgi:hypothetical protein